MTIPKPWNKCRCGGTSFALTLHLPAMIGTAAPALAVHVREDHRVTTAHWQCVDCGTIVVCGQQEKRTDAEGSA